MESNQLTGKLAKWALILQGYNFDIVHKVGKVKWDTDGLSWNPSFIEEDITCAKWHGEVHLEVIPKWHAFVDMCILLGCFRDVPQGNTSSGNFHNDDDEPEGNGVLDIHLDLLFIAYLHVGEVLMGLTPKEQD